MFGNDVFIASLAAESEYNRKFFKEKNIFKNLSALLVISVFFGLFVIACPKVLVEIEKFSDSISLTLNNMLDFSDLKQMK